MGAPDFDQEAVLTQMNLLFARFGVTALPALPIAGRVTGAAGIVLLALLAVVCPLRAQNAGDSNAEFKRLTADLSTARLNGAVENEAQQEKALAFLDSLASSLLDSAPAPDLDAANQRLASLVSHTPPIGENYRLVKLGGSPVVYAMVVNFGLSGPAAVRIYARDSNRYGLAARIDHFSEKDFLDSDIELVPVSTVEPVFVTVSGRTDDLSTGLFSVWRFDGHRAVPLWSSDLLQQSSYEAKGNEFYLTYCAQADEDHPAQCPRMTRDVYRLQAGEWKRTGTADLAPAKPPAK
jgi:hypothetical protein